MALLGIAADPSSAPARRLAAATYSRNTLRKAWEAAPPKPEDAAAVSAGTAAAGTASSAYFPPASRAAVRAAALSALIAAPADARRLLADCLRLAGSTAVAGTTAKPSADAPAAAAAPASDATSDLVDDVIGAAASSSSLTPGLLLAVHAAARPFQYFRDPTVGPGKSSLPCHPSRFRPSFLESNGIL